MAKRVRRRQDDDGAARSPYPSLRNHRNRQRKLALQAPQLSAVPPRLAPVGKQAPPALRYAKTRGGRSAPRGALPFATGTSLPRSRRGVPFTCRSGVPFPCRLTTLGNQLAVSIGSSVPSM